MKPLYECLVKAMVNDIKIDGNFRGTFEAAQALFHLTEEESLAIIEAVKEGLNDEQA